MDNHQKHGVATNTVLEEEGAVIRPAAFAESRAREKKRKKEIWTEEDRVAESDKFKDQYVEEIAMTACEAMLRVFAAAGLTDLDKDNVKQFLMTFESVKALGCAAMGLKHEFHAVAEKIIHEPDDKTRSLVGYMVMSAEGTLRKTEDDA